MSFGEHLEELRRRVLLALLFPLPVAIILYFVSDTLIQWLRLPLDRVLRAAGLPQQLMVLSPAEAIMTQLKLSIIGALILSAPWILWQAWLFIKPGLFRHEQRFVYLLLPGSGVLTAIGMALMYFVMLPLMLSVLVSIGAGMRELPAAPALDPRAQAIIDREPSLRLLAQPPRKPTPGDAWVMLPDLATMHFAVEATSGGVEVIAVTAPSSQGLAQQFRLSEYINFVLLLFLAISLAFQMPLVVLLLGWLGLATVTWLRRQRAYALMTCTILAAVITPPDVVSMLLMLVPLYGLYELGILLLAIAPASAVAQGRVLRRWRHVGDGGGDADDHAGRGTRPQDTVARRRGHAAAAEPHDRAEIGS